MDLIRNYVIIDKMVQRVGVLRSVFIKTDFIYDFVDTEPSDNEGKRLVSMDWWCKIIHQAKADLNLAINIKQR